MAAKRESGLYASGPGASMFSAMRAGGGDTDAVAGSSAPEKRPKGVSGVPSVVLPSRDEGSSWSETAGPRKNVCLRVPEELHAKVKYFALREHLKAGEVYDAALAALEEAIDARL